MNTAALLSASDCRRRFGTESLVISSRAAGQDPRRHDTRLGTARFRLKSLLDRGISEVIRRPPMRRHPRYQVMGLTMYPAADHPTTRSRTPFNPAVDNDCQIQSFVVTIGPDRVPHVSNEATFTQFGIVMDQPVTE
jgi:hypothetical protein